MDVDNMISPKGPAPSCEYCPCDHICLACGFCVMVPSGKLHRQGPFRTVAA